jgi:predicted MFS family arabinose efflux permease
MATYKFDPQLAGGIVTAYLVGTLVSNAILSRRFGSLPEKAIAVIGFAVPAIAFVTMTFVPEVTFLSNATALVILHFIGGAGAGAGLVIVHGVIGRSANPHRLFATVNFGVSLWAVLFFATMARFLPSMGVNAVFLICAVMAGVAAIGALIAFPGPGASARPNAATKDQANATVAASSVILALCFIGVVCLQTSEAMTFSFVERIGDFRGFAPDSIKTMLIASSFLPLVAPVLAGLMQSKLPALNVAICGLIFHGLLSATVSNSTGFMPYAIAASMMISTVIFTHCFIFGLLAKLDPSGRTNAATPSMLMIGTAIGPVVGGTVAKFIGYESVGTTACATAFIGAVCFLAVRQKLRAASAAIVAKPA